MQSRTVSHKHLVKWWFKEKNKKNTTKETPSFWAGTSNLISRKKGKIYFFQIHSRWTCQFPNTCLYSNCIKIYTTKLKCTLIKLHIFKQRLVHVLTDHQRSFTIQHMLKIVWPKWINKIAQVYSVKLNMISKQGAVWWWSCSKSYLFICSVCFDGTVTFAWGQVSWQQKSRVGWLLSHEGYFLHAVRFVNALQIRQLYWFFFLPFFFCPFCYSAVSSYLLQSYYHWKSG